MNQRERFENVTRAEIEACARLLDMDFSEVVPNDMVSRIVTADLLALARAARLIIDHNSNAVLLGYGGASLSWPADGTEADCIIKAAAAVQLEKEKQQ